MLSTSEAIIAVWAGFENAFMIPRAAEKQITTQAPGEAAPVERGERAAQRRPS